MMPISHFVNIENRIVAIDLLKIFAIVAIMVRHLHWFFSMSINIITTNIVIIFGELGVYIFLFCSAFGLSISAVKKGGSVPVFWRQRYLRVFPLYLLALIFYGFFVVQLDWWNFGVHAFGLHSFFLPLSHKPEPYWFMGVLLQLYIIFPILFGLLAYSRQFYWLLVVVLYLANYALLNRLQIGYDSWQMFESAIEDSSIFSFIPVVALAIDAGYHMAFRQANKIEYLWAFYFSLALLAIIYIIFHYIRFGLDYHELFLFGKKVFFVFVSLFLLAFLWISSRFPRLSRLRICAIIASGSYCTYLFHEFVFFFVSIYVGTNFMAVIVALGMAIMSGVFVQKTYDKIMASI